MTDLRTALQSRLDRYRAQYRDGAISAAEFQFQLINLPYIRWRNPPGCPDSNFCNGNGTCYWDCQGDPDEGMS
jgi:hypothetical protein